MSGLIRWLRRIRYRCWLVFGGQRTESGFRFLSKEVLSNAKMIYEIRQEMRSLKRRIWELEGHSTKETLDKVRCAMTECATRAEHLAQGENDR